MVAKLILIDGFILITNLFICAGVIRHWNDVNFDLETDGFLNDCTQIHCLSIYDDETDRRLHNNQGNKEPVVRGVQRSRRCGLIVGHNIIGFDIPVIRQFYPWFPSVLIALTSCA